jgi:hypothetical protein
MRGCYFTKRPRSLVTTLELKLSLGLGYRPSSHLWLKERGIPHTCLAIFSWLVPVLISTGIFVFCYTRYVLYLHNIPFRVPSSVTVMLNLKSWSNGTFYLTRHFSSRDSSVGIAKGHGLDGLGSNSRRGKIFLFCTTSRPTLRPVQPPIPWVPGVKQPGHVVPRSRMVELYLHSLIRFHGVVFNELSTRKIYFFLRDTLHPAAVLKNSFVIFSVLTPEFWSLEYHADL